MKNEYICLICNKKFETFTKLKNHINRHHDLKLYYDVYLKKDNEGFCKICGKETKFTGRYIGEYSGYKLTCSKECANKLRFINRTKSNLEIFGVENVFQRNDVKEKIKQTFIKHYGVNNNMKSEKGKKALKTSNQQKYGVDYILSLSTVIEKRKKNNLKKYGVENVFQIDDIFKKCQKTRCLLKNFRDTKIHYRGTYELDFLEKYFNVYPDIQNGPTIKYNFNGKIRVYFPDFYIPSLNLIIEIKNSYLANRDKEQIEAKEKATIANGFKYIMILNKNYSVLNILLSAEI